MEVFILYAALIFMPVFAFTFIMTLISLLQRLKHDKELHGVGMVCGISFALMMWTLSSSILLSAS